MEYSEYLKLKTWVNLVLCEFDFDGNYLEVISKLMFVVPALAGSPEIPPEGGTTNFAKRF